MDLLITSNAYDKESYMVSPAQLLELARSEHYQNVLAQYRAGNKDKKLELPALIPQGRRKNTAVTSHLAGDLYMSGWIVLDDDRPATEITAEERHRKAEAQLLWSGMYDLPRVAMRSASMKYHLLLPSPGRGSIQADWQYWADFFKDVLVLDSSTTNVNRLLFFTGEMLTGDESLALLGETVAVDRWPLANDNCLRFNDNDNVNDNCQLSTVNCQLEEVASQLLLHLCGTLTPPEGTRNNMLYECTRQMAYLDGITEEAMMEAFAPLGYLGLPEREARQCIRSAMRHEKTWKYTLPPELAMSMASLGEEGKGKREEGKATTRMVNSSLFTLNSSLPSLPSLVALFTAHVPDNARQAVSSMIFAPLGAYLNNSVTIRDVSNKQRNLQFTSIVVGNSSSGKGFVDYVSDFITRRLRSRDAASWKALEAWAEQKRTLPKGDPAPLKPVVPLRLLSSNMTEPALLERLKALEPTAGRAYIKAAEIDELRKFQATGTKLGGGQDIILSAFDTASYGALRVSAEAVSTMTTMSVNICASSTYPGTQEFFRSGVERGSVGRCDFSIVNDSYEVPLYHDFTPEAARQLDLWLDRLENATGEITNPDIDRLIEDIRLSYHDPASPLGWQQNPEYFKLCHRQLLITKQKATILYICNDYQWDPAWEEWLTQSFYYGMQCKISIFASEIASWTKRQNTCVTHIAVHGPKSDLADLPDTFTLADLIALKRSKTPAASDAEIGEKAKSQLRQWTRRRRILPTDQPDTWTKA